MQAQIERDRRPKVRRTSKRWWPTRAITRRRHWRLVNETLGMRTYIPEPKRKTPWKWSDRPAAERRAVTANHRRVRGERSKKLQRRRSELTERSFAHVCETGGARRCWLHGMLKVSKRYLLQVAARNLGLIMRKLFGMGTPRGLQKEGDPASLAYLLGFVAWCLVCLRIQFWLHSARGPIPARARRPAFAPAAWKPTFSTGC